SAQHLPVATRRARTAACFQSRDSYLRFGGGPCRACKIIGTSEGHLRFASSAHSRALFYCRLSDARQGGGRGGGLRLWGDLYLGSYGGCFFAKPGHKTALGPVLYERPSAASARAF